MISIRVCLLVKILSLFVVTQFYISCKYDCCYLASVSYSECCAMIVKSSMNESTCVFGSVGVGMS